jgi:hypothetical protein
MYGMYPWFLQYSTIPTVTVALPYLFAAVFKLGRLPDGLHVRVGQLALHAQEIENNVRLLDHLKT